MNIKGPFESCGGVTDEHEDYSFSQGRKNFENVLGYSNGFIARLAKYQVLLISVLHLLSVMLFYSAAF